MRRRQRCEAVCNRRLYPTGQIELYTHLPVMRQLVEQLQQWEFRVCGVFLVDSQFMVESFKVKRCRISCVKVFAPRTVDFIPLLVENQL